MVWWKTLGKIGGGVAVGLTANYHLSTSPIDVAKLREEEIGAPPTPMKFPEDMETAVATKFINSIGDTYQRITGTPLFRFDSGGNRAALMKLKEILPDEEWKEVEKPFVLMDKNANGTKGVSPFAIMILTSFTERCLKARYQVEKTYNENKEEIEKEKLKPQIIVTGLPRTGSTFLHQLLSQDPNCRFLSAWEQQIPVPFPTKETYKSDVRIKQCQGYQQMADNFVKNYNKYFRMYHDVDGAQVEEELYVLLHTLAMPCIVPFSQDHMDWYMEQNKFPQYAYLKKFLKLSQFYNPPQSHFVLKSPVHGWHFGELLHTFNQDRLIVVTHRDPLKVVPSLSKLQLFVSGLYLRDIQNDPFVCREQFGKRNLFLCTQIVDLMKKVRENLDPKIEKDIFDVEFNDIVADPMKVVERIYERANIELTPEARQTMEDYLAENYKQRKSGKGSSYCPYTLEEFGFTEEGLKETFQDYRKARGYEK